MNMQLLEGFDQVPGASDIRETLQNLGYIVLGDADVEWGEGRHDTSQALALTQDADNVEVLRTFAYAGNSLVIGLAVNTTERAQILEVSDVLTVGWSDEGMLLRDQVSTAKPIRNRWYYLELILDKQALTCSLHINGELDMTAPLPDALSEVEEVTLRLGGVNPTNVAGQPAPETGFVPCVMRFDDLYVSDALLNPIEVYTRFPDADVTTEWNTPTGDGEHWPEVTQQPPTDARYITSFVNGAIDEFTSSTALPVDAQVVAVGVTARARKGDIDDRALGLRFDGEEQVQTDLTLESEWYSKFFAAPSEGPWTAAQIEAATFGVAVR